MREKSIKIEKNAYNQLLHIQLFLSKKHVHRHYSKKRILSMAIQHFIEKLNEMYGKSNQEED